MRPEGDTSSASFKSLHAVKNCQHDFSQMRADELNGTRNEEFALRQKLHNKDKNLLLKNMYNTQIQNITFSARFLKFF